MNSILKLDDDAALDAAEVKALIAALRATPEAPERLRETFQRVKDRLTPAGREVYRRELTRLQRRAPTIPRRIEDLPEGEYGIAVRGDDCSESFASLRCFDGRIALELALAEDGAPALLEVTARGAIDARIPSASGELVVQGELATRDGYLLLDARVSGVRGGRRVLSGTGDVRASRA
jgi:hypothetical protein